jgi:hypothetical protein
MISVQSARDLLRKHGQEHLLAFYDSLDEAGRQGLLAQIEQLDLDPAAPDPATA